VAPGVLAARRRKPRARGGGDDELLALPRRRAPLDDRAGGGLRVVPEALPPRDGPRRIALRAIGNAYKTLMPWFALLALAGAVAASWGARRTCRAPALAGVALVLASAVAVRLVMLAYIEVTSFPAMNVLYLAPVFPLGLMLCAACVHDGLGALRAPRSPRGSAP
jgi:hypothetical protein